jgi:hypothetical protein
MSGRGTLNMSSGGEVALLAFGAFAAWILAAIDVTLLSLGVFDDGANDALRVTLLVLTTAAVVAWLVTLGIALVNVHRREDLSAESRRRWTGALVLLAGVALPVWWWRFVRPQA